MDALEHLTDATLGALSQSLRSHGLAAPFTPASVGKVCGAEAAPVAAVLQRLHEEGMRASHMALLVETIVRTRARKDAQADHVELVWTGPELPGLHNRDTGVVVRELFGSAELEVLVAGFAVYQGQEVFKRLAQRMEERPLLSVRLFLDIQRSSTDAGADAEVVHQFVHRFRSREWPGTKLPELYYDPRSLDCEAVKRSCLHAKCVVVDRRTALVTSANFTEAAQLRNIEVGALVRSDWFAARLAEHFDALVASGLLSRVI